MCSKFSTFLAGKNSTIQKCTYLCIDTKAANVVVEKGGQERALQLGKIVKIALFVCIFYIYCRGGIWDKLCGRV